LQTLIEPVSRLWTVNGSTNAEFAHLFLASDSRHLAGSNVLVLVRSQTKLFVMYVVY